MTGIDIVILVVIAVSGLVSWFRGIIKEVVSLAAWVLAIIVTFLFSHKFATVLPESFGSQIARTVASALILFFGILLIGWFAAALVRQIFTKIKLKPVDRVLGFLFGVARGVAIVTLIVLGLQLTAVPDEPWWHQSFLLPKFQQLAVWAQGWLPAEVAGIFRQK